LSRYWKTSASTACANTRRSRTVEHERGLDFSGPAGLLVDVEPHLAGCHGLGGRRLAARLGALDHHRLGGFEAGPQLPLDDPTSVCSRGHATFITVFLQRLQQAFCNFRSSRLIFHTYALAAAHSWMRHTAYNEPTQTTGTCHMASVSSVGAIATADDLLSAGEIGRCELVQGELVMMSPAGFEHGVITQRIAAALHAFVSARQLGVVTAAETGFLLCRSPDTVRAPDVAFVASSRVPRGRTVGYFAGAPDLAVEVLSPTDLHDAAALARAEAKLYAWLEAGCREVWAVDPSNRTITIHRPSAPSVVVRETETLTSAVLPGLTVRLIEVFLPREGG
jgi:Uma2 family endonuclease